MKRASLVIGFVLLMWLLGFAPCLSAFPAATDEQIAQACSVDAPKGSTMLPSRMPEIPFDKMTEAQKEVALSEFATRIPDDFHKASTTTTPRVTPPYSTLLRSPEVLRQMKRLNVYLQDHSALPMKLRQFIIMMTARQWSVQYTYGVHCPQAVQAGISLETARAIGEGRRPVEMAADEEIVYDFIDELHRNQSVSDETYARALAKFGEQGIVDMVSLNGWYTFFLMTANVVRVPWRQGTPNIPMFPH
jgi:4-carboxymuconolactone decarboxylase